MRDRVEIWLIEHVAKIHDDTRSHYDVIVGNCAMAAQLFGFWMEHSPNYRHSRDIHISLFSSRNNRGWQSRGKLKYTNARQRSIHFTSVFALAARLITADFNGDLNARDFLSNSQRVQFIPMLWLISNVCRSIKEPVKVIVASGYLVGGCYNVMWFISVWIYGWYYVRLTDYIRIDVSLVQTYYSRNIFLFSFFLSFFSFFSWFISWNCGLSDIMAFMKRKLKNMVYIFFIVVSNYCFSIIW